MVLQPLEPVWVQQVDVGQVVVDHAAQCRTRSTRSLVFHQNGGMAAVTIYHNPNCSTSKFALAEAERLGVDVDVVQYLKAPLDRPALLALLDQLEDPPADLVRKDSFFQDQGLDAADYQTPETVADLLVEHPRLMQRPVLVRNGRAIIGRPKDRVEPFLTS